MKNFVIGLFILLLAGCSKNTGNVEKLETDYNIPICGRNLNIVIIDGCEYLYGNWGSATVLTHKGNCKNHKK